MFLPAWILWPQNAMYLEFYVFSFSHTDVTSGVCKHISKWIHAFFFQQGKHLNFYHQDTLIPWVTHKTSILHYWKEAKESAKRLPPHPPLRPTTVNVLKSGLCKWVRCTDLCDSVTKKEKGQAAFKNSTSLKLTVTDELQFVVQ